MSIAIHAPASWYDPSELYDQYEPEDDPEMDSLEESQPYGRIMTIEEWEDNHYADEVG